MITTHNYPNECDEEALMSQNEKSSDATDE